MSLSRWPAVVILAGLIVAAWVVDRDHERPGPEPIDAATPLEVQGFLPVAAPEDAITSTWYCPGGTADDDGIADTTIVVANTTEEEQVGEITIFPNRANEEGRLRPRAPVTVEATFPGQDRFELRLQDEAPADYAAALVESDGGGLVVEQQVEGPEGADVSPCATQASDTWYFAAGRTTSDATQLLAFFNPFPDPAVIDVRFRTEVDLRTPVEFEGYVVPARSVVVEDIGLYVTRRNHVSTSVVARTGRLVVNRLFEADGSEGLRGLEVSTGTARPAESWYFPDGVVAQGIEETFVIYNPTETAAEVDLVIEVDDVERLGEIEPFGLTIPPEGFQEVAVHDEERIGTALEGAGGEDVLIHGARVVSLNDIPIVAERMIAGESETARAGLDLAFGAPLLTDHAAVAASTPDEVLIVQNPSGRASAQVTVRSLDGGSLGESTEATEIEVPAASRVVLVLSELGLTPNRPVLVESDRPVAIESRLAFDDPSDTSGAIAVPLAGSASEPPSLFDDG
jgi:hypothetical protein